MWSERLHAARLGAASPRAQRQPQTQRLQRQRGPAAGPGDGRLAWAVQPGHVEGDWQALARVREEPMCVLVWVSLVVAGLGVVLVQMVVGRLASDGAVWEEEFLASVSGGRVRGVTRSSTLGKLAASSRARALGETLGARCERLSRQAVRHDDDGDDDVDANGVVVATAVDDRDEVDGHGCDVGDGWWWCWCSCWQCSW